MKKFFSFKSSGSRSENKNSSSRSLTDIDAHWEQSELKNNAESNPKAFFSKSRKQSVEHHDCLANSGIRKSRSLSSAASQRSGLDQIDFSRSSDRSGSQFTISSNTINRPSTSSQSERPRSSTSYASLQKLPGSSLSSSNLSSIIVDRYIDGDQREVRTFFNDLSKRTHAVQRQETSRRPPRAQYTHTAPSSPVGTSTEKPKSHPFRDVRGSEWEETVYDYESPRKLAKNVIERLSQCSALHKTSPKDDPSSPITIEDLYVGSLNRPSCQYPPSLDGASKVSRAYDVDGLSSFQKKNSSVVTSEADSNSAMDEDEIDVELQSALKEANERALFLSEGLKQQRFICDDGFDVSALIQKIKSLAEEKVNLAFEVSSVLQSHIADRAKANKDLKHLKTELYNQLLKLKREKCEIQSGLEKELDRRSTDWSLNLEKYQSEEYRLRERVRELAEKNVAMQREISAAKEKEIENRNTMMHSDQQQKDQTMRLDKLRKQNQDLSDNLVQLKEQYKAATKDRDCFHKNYEQKETECKDLHKSVTRLTRTTCEQEKTISELRESLIEKIEGKQFPDISDKHTKKLQAEQIRLTGVEQALRKEVESYRLEAESLRHENIELLNRLRSNEKEGCSFTFKLDQEMWARIQCLQEQGLALLDDSTHMCSKLQGIIKAKAHTISDAQQVAETIRNGLDGQYMIESDVKIQGFKRRIDSMNRSLQTMSVLLTEKRKLAAPDQQSNCTDDEQKYRINMTSERILKSELKAETLLTNLLREKLHCKELELEQLHAELATSVRGNEILKCEVQNALDSISCVNHTIKELELQNLKKEKNINQTQSDLHEITEELTMIKGILPKVSDERDLMWEEVKQYSERNMLLNSEINALKRKIEALDEEVLLKDGQISILKDSLGRKPLYPYDSPNSTKEFLLD
ncbi:hypothetical protein QQ045_015875 [Rhodiola kirilowii]